MFADHVKFLTTRQDQLLAQLRALAAAGLARAQEEYEKALLAWGARALPPFRPRAPRR